jgi:integrase
MRRKQTLEEALSIFLETDSAQKAERSQRADRRFFKIALLYFTGLGRKYCSDIELEDIQRFALWLEKPQSIGGIEKEAWAQPSIALRFQTLKKLFRKLFLTERIRRNPFDLFKVDRGQSRRRRPMTLVEFEKIQTLAPDWVRPVLAFMRLTGARGASIAMLTWGDVDFERHGLILKSRKGGARRMKEIHFPLYPALEELLEKERFKYLEHPPPESPIFLGPSGQPVTAQDISTAGSRLIKRAGIKGVVLYGLRHAIATELTEAGVPLEITRQAMGHSSIGQTSHYASGIASKAVSDALELIRKTSK